MHPEEDSTRDEIYECSFCKKTYISLIKAGINNLRAVPLWSPQLGPHICQGPHLYPTFFNIIILAGKPVVQVNDKTERGS